MKKALALLLALIMLLSLAACGGTTAETGDDSGSVYTEEMANAEFRGVYTDPQWDGSLPLVQEGEDNKITIGLVASANVTDYDENVYTKWLEEQTGVDIEFVMFAGSSSDAKTQISLMIAGGEEMPDIILGVSVGKAVMKEYGRDGYFLNMSEYLATDAYYLNQSLREQYPTEEAYNNKVHSLKGTIMDPKTGGMYGFPYNYLTPLDTPDNHLWINQQWLDNLGLKAPTNIDELYDVLVAFRDNDPNGNGLKDEVPMVGIDKKRNYDVVSYIINAFMYYLPNYRVGVENDVVYSFYDQPEYREAILFINKLVKEGLLSPLTWTQSSAEMKALMNPSQGELTVGIGALPGEGFQEGNQSVEAYVPLDYMDAATPRGGYFPMYDDTFSYSNYITADCDNPRLAFRLLDFMASGDSYLRQYYGEYGVDWEFVPEGETMPGHSGGDAKVIVLKPAVFQSVNAQNWHSQHSMCSEGYWQRYQPAHDGSYLGNIFGDLQIQYENCVNRGQPEQVFYVMARNDEEDEIFNDYNGDLGSFIEQSRAKFCTGEMDPSNDTQWDQYISDLYGLHYKEAWVDVAQAVWDREYKK